MDEQRARRVGPTGKKAVSDSTRATTPLNRGWLTLIVALLIDSALSRFFVFDRTNQQVVVFAISMVVVHYVIRRLLRD